MSEIVTECTCGQLPALPRNQQLDAYDRARWGATLSDADLDAMRARFVAAELEPAEDRWYEGNLAGGCEACGAEAGEECRPMCIGLAAHQDATGEDVNGMTPAQMVAILRSDGIDAELVDLPGCPGSHTTPFPCARIAGGWLAVGRQDDVWPVADEPIGEALHVQTELDDYDDARFMAWQCNAREALSILRTFGARIGAAPQ